MVKIKYLLLLAATFFIGHWLAMMAYNPILYAVLTLPGTFLHESMHYLVASALNGDPSGFSLFPTWENGQMATLGHVMMHPNWYNAAPTGVAPLLLAPFTFFFVAVAAKVRSILKSILLSYGAACSWAACIPSDADLSIANGQPISWVFAAVMIGVLVLCTIYGVRYLLRSVQSSDGNRSRWNVGNPRPH